jgi:DNA-binding beta-propeller fold protein YncE
MDYDTSADTLCLAHVSIWGSGRLQKPYDLDYDEDRNFLYVIDYKSDELIVFDQGGTIVEFYGSTGSGPGQFRQPRGISWDSHGGAQYVFVADTGNHRIVRLRNRPGNMPDLAWENQYSEPFFMPLSVTSSGGSGLYAVVSSVVSHK